MTDATTVAAESQASQTGAREAEAREEKIEEREARSQQSTATAATFISQGPNARCSATPGILATSHFDAVTLRMLH